MTINDDKKEYYRLIYERNVDDIYRLCFSYLKNTHNCEDAVSAVFYKLMKKNPKFETTEQEKGWLVVTACNECKSMLRSFRKHSHTPIEEAPETAVTEDYEKQEIIELMMTLPEKYAFVIYLHFYMGYSLVDIAKMTKQKESTIRSRLFYAKKKLAKLLGGSYEE